MYDWIETNTFKNSNAIPLYDLEGCMYRLGKKQRRKAEVRKEDKRKYLTIYTVENDTPNTILS